MAQLYEYRCWGCSWTVMSGNRQYLCPYCGGSLFFLGSQYVVDPIKDTEIEEAMEDILSGLEGLLKSE